MVEERVEKSFEVPRDSVVIVRNSNGSVSVRAEGRGSGSAAARRMIEPDLPHTKYIEVEIDPGPPMVVRCSYSLSRVRASVDLEVVLPPDIKSLEAETLNGNIVVTGFDCRTRLSTGNGFIRLSSDGGPVEAVNRNGGIDVSGRAILSSLSAVNGDIRAGLASVDGAATVETVTGSVLIEAHDGLDADLDLRTGRGTIMLDGLSLMSPTATPGRLCGRLGSGAGRLSAATRLGDITLARPAPDERA